MNQPPPLMDRLHALLARVPRGMLLGLDRVEHALAALGHPQRALTVIHVAGSNGKGSTSAMVESIARAAGLRTGLYTSPHLCRFAERIRIEGVPIADAPFERALQAVIERCRPDLTFFESLTVAAFFAFREAALDLVVLEVGLGGRLDATNVIEAPLATAITSIALEHTALLGETLGAIAREKAGIFKAGAPVVLGPLSSEADAAACDVAVRAGAGSIVRVVRGLDEPRTGILQVSFDGARTTVRGPGVQDVVSARLRLEGAHQAENAGVAVGLVQQAAARWPALHAATVPGLENAQWPGRMERIEQGGVTVILDAAHNPDGAQRLANALGGDPSRTTLVFGALADKRWQEMLRTLAPLGTRRWYTEPKGRTPANPQDMVKVAAGAVERTPRTALHRALAECTPGDTVVVTGSIYLVGDLRAELLGIEADPVIAL